jgi:thiol-disulfide isomerase/thioredoxin
MSSQPGQIWRNRRVIGLAALAGALVGLAAIYVKGPGEGNAVAARCQASVARAATLAPLARGEVAALLVAERPISLAELSFTGPDGELVGMADFAGRTLLLNLWATWCVPCREEMPALESLQTAAGGRDFQVVAVNIDNRASAQPRKFLDGIGVTGLTYYEDSSMKVFEVLKQRGLASGLPTTVLLDGNACVLGAVQGPATWNSDEAVALIRAASG